MVATRGQGEGGMGSYCLVGADFQFCRAKGPGGGRGPRLHNRVSVPIPLNCTLHSGCKVGGCPADPASCVRAPQRQREDLDTMLKKMAKVANFTLCIFHHD